MERLLEVSGLFREWDAAEGARFTDHVQAGGPSGPSVALVSSGLQGAADRVSLALGGVLRARSSKRALAASATPTAAVVELRDAVTAYAMPPESPGMPPWRRAARCLPDA